jgi:hypothetical protein
LHTRRGSVGGGDSFALVFALAMDYTAFLLATTKEAYERTGDAR